MEPDQEPQDHIPYATRVRLVRYLLGEATENDRAEIEQRLTSDPDFETVVDTIRGWWQMQGGISQEIHLTDSEHAESKAAWVRVASKTGVSSRKRYSVGAQVGLDSAPYASIDEKKQSFAPKKQGFSKQTLRRVTQFAGIVVGMVLLTFVARHHAPVHNGVTRTYSTRDDQRADVTLDDGTRVALAPRSTIRLVHFGSDRRTVTLDGEAYFDVTHADGAPFIVHSGGVAMHVLGTAFLVRHYDSDRIVRVAVASGRVSVTMPRRKTPSVLAASDVGEIIDSTITVHSVSNLNVDTQSAGGLMFTNVPVGDVLATLTRWYGYEFRYTDSTIARQNVTVWLSTQSSSTALATLARLLHVSLTVAGDTVTLTPRREVGGQGMKREKSYDIWTHTREVGR